MNIQILPSLLAADVGALGAEIARVARSGADALHLDIMDAHFVPNLSFGPDVVALARRVAPGLFRNVHLMMTRPDLYLEAFARAGAQTIQVHVEADCDLHAELARIRALGLRAGLVLNPETPAGRVFPYLKACDELLVMTVHPEGHGRPRPRPAPRRDGRWRRERRDGRPRRPGRRQPVRRRQLPLPPGGHGGGGRRPARGLCGRPPRLTW